jgi:tRNA-specific 2-thiouridylase
MGSKKVFVGLSGGVDSSVSAALLQEQGYDVTGVFMKNWSKDLPGFPCPWKEDYQDAKRVAVKLGIPFELFDFEQEYFDKVVEYMLDGFKSGITPNPDVMCNQEIKFKLFYELAREKGADYIATGHYARVARVESGKSKVKGQLQTAVDDNKDQTYFLYRVSEDALARTLFPLGDMTKPQVREEATKRGLITANKKESMGICFVGKVGIREFLSQYVETTPGAIIEQNGLEIGQHDGAIFYTIGQRHGLDVGGGLPYYVTGKDMKKNEVYVTSNIQDENLWSDTINLTETHWINNPPVTGKTYQIRTRHRAPLAYCKFFAISGSKSEVKLDEKMRALTPGQSAVFYDGNICIGGGVIA